MREDQGPNYQTKCIVSKAFKLPEGITVAGACELLCMLSADFESVELPNKDELRMTCILRDSDDRPGVYTLSTQLQYFPEPLEEEEV